MNYEEMKTLAIAFKKAKNSLNSKFKKAVTEIQRELDTLGIDNSTTENKNIRLSYGGLLITIGEGDAYFYLEESHKISKQEYHSKIVNIDLILGPESIERLLKEAIVNAYISKPSLY
jgi:hypothetical protein